MQQIFKKIDKRQSVDDDDDDDDKVSKSLGFSRLGSIAEGLTEGVKMEAKKQLGNMLSLFGVNKSESEFEKKKKYIDSYTLMIRRIDILTAILGILGVLLSIYEYELYFRDTPVKLHFESDDMIIILRWLISLSTLGVIVLLGMHSVLKFRKDIETEKLDFDSNYFKSENFKILLVEIFINIIHCPPYIDYVFTSNINDFDVKFSLDGIIMCFMLSRSYLLIRLYTSVSQYNDDASVQICEREGCNNQQMFAIKAFVYDKPLVIIVTKFKQSLVYILITCMLTFGIAIRHFERAYQYEAGKMNFDYFWNAFWLVLITMTTVGYGDFYPCTLYGRLIAITSAFFGIFVTSLMVLNMRNTLSMDDSENRAFNLLFRLQIKDQIKSKASDVIKQVILLRGLQIKHEQKQSETLQDYYVKKVQYRMNLDIKINLFKEQLQKIPEYEESPIELMRQMSEYFDQQMDDLHNICISMMQIQESFKKNIQAQKEIIEQLHKISFQNQVLQNTLDEMCVQEDLNEQQQQKN